MFFLKDRIWKIGFVLVSAFALWLSYYALFYNTGVKGGTDNYVHFHFSKYSWDNSMFFLDLWAKPIYTLLSSPFAQFGFFANKFFNVLVGLGTGFLAFRILEIRKIRLSFLAILFVVSAPIYILMMPTAMTEPLCSFFLIGSIFLVVKERYVASAIILSFIFLVRNEAFVFLPIFAFFFFIKKKYKAIPFLATGFLVFSVIGTFVFGDFFWLIEHNPYDGNRLYGTGSMFSFAEKADRIFGVAQLLMFGFFLVLLLRRPWRKSIGSFEIVLLLLPALVFFTAHSYVYWKGIGNSMGLIRVMAVISPLISMMAVIALNRIFSSINKLKAVKFVFVIAICCIVAYAPFVKDDLPYHLGPNDIAMHDSVEWFKKTDLKESKVYYYSTYIPVLLERNPFDNSVTQERVPNIEEPGVGIEKDEILFWDSQFGPNEGQLPYDRIIESDNFELLNSFYTNDSATVWTGDLYKMCIFRRK